MRGNIVVTRIPTSITRKIRISTKVHIQGKQEEIRSFTPTERKKTITDYLKNRITPSPQIFLSESPVKLKPLTPKSITLNTPDLSPMKNFETPTSFLKKSKLKSDIKKKKSSRDKSPRKINELKKNELFSLNDSIEYVPENHRLKVIGSPSSTLINRKNTVFESLKTLSDLKYLIYSKPNKTRIRSKTFKKFNLPKIHKGSEIAFDKSK